jgi:cyclic pyranopterin phosphate synthase
MSLTDRLDRPVHDLRISVTDRCNFRCTYCMPKEIFGKDYEFLARDEILGFDEIVHIARAFVERGVEKIRITGGEPLLRKGIEGLVESLAAIPGVQDLTLTTNGSLLARKAKALAAAGLDRVTVSLDAVDEPTFQAMNDVGYPVAAVLHAIDVAASAGLSPIKINCVVQKGVNDHAVPDMARHFKGTGHIVRFIEFMDVGNTNGWRLDDVVPAAEVVRMVDEIYPLEAVPSSYAGEVANRFRYRDGSGEIGVIASVTKPFCGSCTRARVSAEGRLFTCLFASKGEDLRGAIREGVDIGAVIDRVWSDRDDRYSEMRSSQTVRIGAPVEMSYIGG